jgi:hypothetical protein
MDDGSCQYSGIASPVHPRACGRPQRNSKPVVDAVQLALPMLGEPRGGIVVGFGPAALERLRVDRKTLSDMSGSMSCQTGPFPPSIEGAVQTLVRPSVAMTAATLAELLKERLGRMGYPRRRLQWSRHPCLRWQTLD